MLGLLKVVRASGLGLKGIVACRKVLVRTVASVGHLVRCLLLVDSFGALRAMSRVSQGLSLLNLLVDESQWVLQVRRLLLIEGRHAELLVHEGLVLAARRSVTVVRVVAESVLVQVAKVGHHSVHTAQETFVFYRNESQLVAE